jgi:hypothetical protein
MNRTEVLLRMKADDVPFPPIFKSTAVKIACSTGEPLISPDSKAEAAEKYHMKTL